MPSSTIADAAPFAQPSPPSDTPTADAVRQLIADAIIGSRRFPSSDLVGTAASLFPAIPVTEENGRDGVRHEGPTFFVTVSPGRLKLWTKDEADLARREQNERMLTAKAADALATWLWQEVPAVDSAGQPVLDDDGNPVMIREAVDAEFPERIPSREITGWSSKSRSNMKGTLADLDYNELFTDPMLPAAMLTFTYPGCWLRVAPNGKAVKAHLKKFRKRFIRKFGYDLPAVWKLEFQGRKLRVRCICDDCVDLDDGRAPHIHMLACPPRVDRDGNPVSFPQWFSATWADVVAHPDRQQRINHERAGTRVDYAEGMRASDPRRVVTYFAKHNGAEAKEYQHCVPKAWQEPGQGPGRFWGYWVLKPAVSSAQLRPEVATQAGRILRRHSRAQQVTRQSSRPRVKGGRAISKYSDIIGLAGIQLVESRTTKYRHVRTRAVRLKNGRGWSMVNDGPAFGIELAMSLHQGIEHRAVDVHRAELERVGLWDTPICRAHQLAPSPRRDALIARLQARIQ